MNFQDTVLNLKSRSLITLLSDEIKHLTICGGMRLRRKLVRSNESQANDITNLICHLKPNC